MRGKLAIGVIGVMIGVLLSTVVGALAGTPGGPGTPPGSTNSYTLADIYHSLNRGTAATPSTFTEPAAGPGTGTMYTLDEIYTLTRQRAPVPKTGQTATYYGADDGYLEKGVAWPSPRFTDNSNGTLTDNMTGLIWLKNANCANATRNWVTALNDVWDLNDLGWMNLHNCGDTSNGGSHQTDWRLPNLRELESLIDYGQLNPALPSGHPFTGVQSGYYWSGTTVAGSASIAWLMHSSGGVTVVDKTFSYYVWPVRGGQ